MLMCVTSDSDNVQVCHKGTSDPAVMTFAGIFAEADPYETGNLVWGNDTPIPDNMSENRV